MSEAVGQQDGVDEHVVGGGGAQLIHDMGRL
jgi:hypothetical protein